MKRYLLLLLIASLLTTTDLFSQNIRIYHIDVEQADATLIITPNGKSLLIDCGKSNDADKIKSILDQENITQIDCFVCTHYHADHYGCIEELVGTMEIPIIKVYDRGDKNYLSSTKYNEPTYKSYQRLVGRKAEHLTRGETIPLDPAISITCFASGGVALKEDPPVSGHDENDMSITLLIKYGSFWYLNGGDITHFTETKIDQLNLIKNVDVYKASHHGANTSSDPGFMNDILPSVIIISNGNHGGYRHPRQETLDNFAQLNPPPEIFQTNKYLKGGDGGNVPDSHIADLESSDADGTILITVDSVQGTYVVEYGTYSQTFSIKQRNQASNSVVISSLLPDPDGYDSRYEELTLRNNGVTPFSLDACMLKDKSGRIWTMAGYSDIAPQDSITIIRNGMPMSLTNTGDSITLLGAADQVLDSFTYSGSQGGVRIYTNH
ncbi:MAG: lamin tail domain-containing protein [Bacteroidales bacterium]|nr:lamin tail domain-containing protein [Bacteroidales bacterium]